MKRSKVIKAIAALAMASLGFSAPAAAAARTATLPDSALLSPWVALSALGSSSSSAALCGSAASATSTSAAQGTTPGCVLPAMDAPAPVVETAPEPVPGAPPAATPSGFNIIPLLLGLAGVAGAVILLLSGDGDDRIVLDREPITQP